MLKNSVLKLVNNQLRTCVIFNFHDIVVDGKPVRPDQLSVATFRQQLSWIQQHFTIVRIDTLVELFQANDINKPMAAVTFDDGYRSHFDLIKPILDEFGIKAAFYVSSAHLNNDYYWHDLVETFCLHSSAEQQNSLEQVLNTLKRQQRSSLVESIKYLPLSDRAIVLASIENMAKPLMKERLLMNASEVLALAATGHLIGGHTLNHPILALETDQTCFHEINDDLQALEALLQQKVTTFAYPNGIPEQDFSLKHQQILADYGIKYAVNTHKSVLTKALNTLSIPRINLFGANESLHCNYLLRMIFKSVINSAN